MSETAIENKLMAEAMLGEIQALSSAELDAFFSGAPGETDTQFMLECIGDLSPVNAHARELTGIALLCFALDLSHAWIAELKDIVRQGICARLVGRQLLTDTAWWAVRKEMGIAPFGGADERKRILHFCASYGAADSASFVATKLWAARERVHKRALLKKRESYALDASAQQTADFEAIKAALKQE